MSGILQVENLQAADPTLFAGRSGYLVRDNEGHPFIRLYPHSQPHHFDRSQVARLFPASDIDDIHAVIIIDNVGIIAYHLDIARLPLERALPDKLQTPLPIDIHDFDPVDTVSQVQSAVDKTQVQGMAFAV